MSDIKSSLERLANADDITLNVFIDYVPIIVLTKIESTSAYQRQLRVQHRCSNSRTLITIESQIRQDKLNT